MEKQEREKKTQQLIEMKLFVKCVHMKLFEKGTYTSPNDNNNKFFYIFVCVNLNLKQKKKKQKSYCMFISKSFGKFIMFSSAHVIVYIQQTDKH